MNEYTKPKIEIVELKENDIITTSPGTETKALDESDGIWNLDISV